MSHWYGYVSALVAVVSFGTYAVPVGLSPVGDGIFFQWVQCCAILMVGFILQLAFGANPVSASAHIQYPNCTVNPYQFEPIAMVGGMLWAIGNVTVVPIIHLIGLGLGVLLWGVVNMAVGWMVGAIPIFLEKRQEVATPWLNYVGLAVAVCSFVLYFFVKVEKKEDSHETENLPLVSDDKLINSAQGDDDDVNMTPVIMSPLKKKIIGSLLSVFGGVCYGFNMTPVTYLSQKYPCAGDFTFAFSHFSGIFFTSTVIMLVYCIWKRNMPYLQPRSVLGALVAGTLWAIAQSGWFVANINLGQPISFPIITTGPAVVANLWAIFYFKEIRGRNNILKLIAAFLVTFVGILLIALSSVDFHHKGAANATAVEL